jgi:protein-S-isoprenylcysteine O-methyltransferase Ste14
VFIIYWGVAALSAKRTLNNAHGRLLWWRLGALMLALVFFDISGIHLRDYSYHPSELMGWLGVILTAFGVAIAIWARMYLASNWGMPMSVKEHPELVTTGPYAYVRHPIYTGVLLGMLGSAFVAGPLWAIVLIIGGSYFTYAVTQEEKLMLKEFPEQYPAYKAHSKMLIPFIL